MRSKQKYLGYAALVLAIIGIIFISGCVQSPETKQFAESLSQTNENLEIALGNIHTDFYNYDTDYSVTKLMNLLTITDSIINGMEKAELNIKEDITQAENIISDYQAAKQNVNMNQLSDEEKNLVNQIDAKINEFNSNKDKLNSCLSKMETYREWIILVKENAELLEKLDNQLILLNEYVQSEKYQDALQKVNEIQNTINQMKINAQKREATGIQDFSAEVMASYDVYSESFEYYKEYINLLINEDYENAESKYIEYSQKYSEAISMGTEEEASISATINEADVWYQNNIGVCLDLFTQYS